MGRFFWVCMWIITSMSVSYPEGFSATLIRRCVHPLGCYRAWAVPTRKQLPMFTAKAPGSGETPRHLPSFKICRLSRFGGRCAGRARQPVRVWSKKGNGGIFKWTALHECNKGWGAAEAGQVPPSKARSAALSMQTCSLHTRACLRCHIQ